MKDLLAQLKQDPPEGVVEPAPGGGLHIPIEKLEDMLDEYDPDTTDYKFMRYIEADGIPAYAASLQLHLKAIGRSYTGACNFNAVDLQEIKDWNATAKSMCVKNAASDAGRYFGRGLNESMNAVPNVDRRKREAKKMIPDAAMRKEHAEAVVANDTEKIQQLEEIYDFKSR